MHFIGIFHWIPSAFHCDFSLDTHRNAKRKLDEDTDEAPVDKKKKKSAAPKKGAARHKGWDKGADADANPTAEDVDAEGEQVDAE